MSTKPSAWPASSSRTATVYQQQDRSGKITEVAVKPGGTATDLPMVVLVDNGTASSAEIVAGALQDAKRGELIGAKTFGTGTVLTQFPLSDGSALLVGTVEWLTRDGRQIWKVGIQPDVSLDFEPEGHDRRALGPVEDDRRQAERIGRPAAPQGHLGAHRRVVAGDGLEQLTVG